MVALICIYCPGQCGLYIIREQPLVRFSQIRRVLVIDLISPALICLITWSVNSNYTYMTIKIKHLKRRNAPSVSHWQLDDLYFCVFVSVKLQSRFIPGLFLVHPRSFKSADVIFHIHHPCTQKTSNPYCITSNHLKLKLIILIQFCYEAWHWSEYELVVKP